MRQAAFLRNLPGAWEQAMLEQRHALARLVIQSGTVFKGTVTASLSTPEFARFFNLAEDNETGRLGLSAPCRQDVLTGGSDGDRLRVGVI